MGDPIATTDAASPPAVSPRTGRPRKPGFVDHVGMRFDGRVTGQSTSSLAVQDIHFNGVGVVHGGVMFTLADTGMGAALYGTLAPDEFCATIEIKINYFKPVMGGQIVCESTLVNRGKTVANLDSSLFVDGTLVAKANGSFAILKRKPKAA